MQSIYDCSNNHLVQSDNNFVAFCSIAFPAQGLKVILYCPAAFCHRNNMIYLKQKVRLNMGRVATGTAREIITVFDKLT